MSRFPRVGRWPIAALLGVVCAVCLGCQGQPSEESVAPENSASSVDGNGGEAASGERESPSDPPSPARSAGETPPEGALRVTALTDAPLRDPQPVVSQEELEAGWIGLFDGQTLFGWRANSATDWRIAEGAIVASGDTDEGLLVTSTEFEDYEFQCEVWLAEGGNSGVFLRTRDAPADPAVECLEFNLSDAHETFPTGSLVGRAKAQEASAIEGDWHVVSVTVEGAKVVGSVDGKVVLEAESPDFLKTGGRRIGLQKNQGEVRFRNVKLRPLGLETVLSAESREGWRAAPQGTSLAVTAEDEGVRLQGEGYLESERTYGDFVLQIEAKLNAADVNSGLFFRTETSTPDAPSNGYEMQMQNTIAEGDRTRPADYGDGFGTGAIFRRQGARYVNADDQEWMWITLVAQGNHFTSWVNGLQVTDFVDDRKVDANPRQGRRDDAGHLSFQGHDPATDVTLRTVRVRPLEPAGN